MMIGCTVLVDAGAPLHVSDFMIFVSTASCVFAASGSSALNSFAARRYRLDSSRSR
jgi:hypothetical protein